MLEEIVTEIIPFDKFDLLSKIAAIQLLPVNADPAIPLNATAHAVASQKYVLDQPEISMKRLKKSVITELLQTDRLASPKTLLNIGVNCFIRNKKQVLLIKTPKLGNRYLCLARWYNYWDQTF